MQHSFTNKQFILYSGLIMAGFFLMCNSAAAKTISVKDIIRQDIPNEEATINAEQIPSDAKIDGAIYHYATTPLFLSNIHLHSNPEAIKSSSYNPAILYTWTKAQLAERAQTSQNARLNIQDNRVTEFNPGQNGFYPDAHNTTITLIQNLQTGTVTTTISGLTTPPDIGLEKTNTLGINTLLSGGLSDFSGSSKNRKANIEAGSKKVRGVLVAPGETFSFGHYLGDVTAEDGFKPEIVIKADGLKPELGGGICQVSSTLFRAVMQSGMPIPTRRNHAFSVNHYFPPGTDATVYTPYTDFKFVNDTPGTVLIWNYYKDDHTLAFDLYGSKDARSVEIDEPIQWDRKSDGSMKASWTRRVQKEGIQREDVFKSNYLPPALFKKEEQFVIAVPPSSNPTQTTPAQPENTPTIHN